MKKFEFGLFALAVLIGGNYGSMFGITIAICSYMVIAGFIEECGRFKKQSKNLELIKKEERKNA